MPDTYFVADPHFGHARIIEICKRPFASSDEQTEVLTENWNSVVKPSDDVWVIGDFCMANPKRYLRKLHGNIHLIRGNHDRYTGSETKAGFASARDTKMLKLKGQELWLAHYAHRVWPKAHYGAWHLFGHSHGCLPDWKNMSLDVGVDNRKKYFSEKDAKKLYAPWSYDEIQSVLSTHRRKVFDRGAKEAEPCAS